MVFNSKEDLEKNLSSMGFSKTKIKLYIEAYNSGANIYPYIDKNIKTQELHQILMGLSDGVDVSWYHDYSSFNHYQMNIIRKGLLLGLDVRWYAKPELNTAQMIAIKAGLEKSLDVSIYADSRLTSSQMWQFFNRMINTDDVEPSHTPKHNYGRFNLEDFEFQKVDFEGAVHECNIISPYKYALLVKQLFWQGEYICDHVWINSTTQIMKQIAGPDGFDFGDIVSFSAEVEPYFHRQDKQKHYGLCRMQNIEVLEKAPYYNNYKVGHKIYVQIANVYYYDKELKESYNAETKFRNLFEIDETVEKLYFELIGYKKNYLVFQLSYDNTFLQVKGLYNPYNGKRQLKVGKSYFFFPLTDSKNKMDRKLGNTFFQAKYLNMIENVNEAEKENSKKE